MKTTLLSLLLTTGLSGMFITQSFAQKDLEAAELGFARMAKETNVREAFLQNFADEGIILLPAPSSAKKFYGEQEPNKVVLEWKPAIVTLAGSGDFGYTTGPSQAKGSPESNEYFYYGQFVSVWEKGINGWKVIFDTGIPHEGPHKAWENKEAELQVLPAASGKMLSITEIETEFLKSLQKKGIQQVYKQYSTSGTRFMRHNHTPQLGPGAVEAFFPKKSQVQYQVRNGKVAASNDLAYSYGSYTFINGQTPEKGYYMRVWKRSGDKWLLELEVWKPEQSEKKK